MTAGAGRRLNRLMDFWSGIRMKDHFPGVSVAMLILFLVLPGCTSVAVKDPLAGEHRGDLLICYSVNTDVEPVELDSHLSDAQNRQQFHRLLTAAVDEMNQYIQLHVAPLSPVRLAGNLDCDAAGRGRPDEEKLYLDLELTGYGALKSEWKTILIGTGAVEAAVQGGVVYAATRKVWLALAVGGEEMTSEYLTWNGADWLLGETFAPVTLEAELTHGKNGRVIWKDSAFVTENEDELDQFDKSVQKRKPVQLMASLHKAEQELISGLNTYLSTEILSGQ